MVEKFVSVIVPVYNDPEGLRDTLNSLINQSIARTDYEILVVDNGSNDGTKNVIERFSQTFNDLIVPLVQSKKGSYAARNKGIENSQGEIICFIDADMTVESDWVSSIVEKMESLPCDYLCCNVTTVLPDDETSLVSKFDVLSRRLDSFPIETYLNEGNWCPTCCLSIRKKVITEVGKFDERMTSSGDYEFGDRVYKADFDQAYAPNIIMYHPARTMLSSQISKSIRLGRGYTQLLYYHADVYNRPGIFNPRHFLPPHPINFINHISNEARRREVKIQKTDVVGLYLLEYINKLSMAYGQISELIDIKTS